MIELLKKKIDQSILKNLVWLLGDKLFRMGGGLLVGVLVAKYLGPEDFGIFNFVFSFVWLFSHFVTLGLDEIVTRELIVKPEITDTLLGTSIVLKIGGGTITFFVIVLSMFLIRSSSFEIVLMTVIMAISMIIKNIGVFRLLFESKLQSKINVLAENAGFIAVSILRIVLIFLMLPLVYFAWALILEVFVSSIAFVYLFYRKGYNLSKWSFDYPIAIGLLKESWPLIISGVSIMIYVKSDQVMLGLLSSNHETGIYSVAARISEIWYFIPVAIVTSFYPSIVESKKISEKDYQNKFSKMFRILFYTATLIAFIMTFLSDYIVLLLFGSAFTESGLVLSIHIWAGVFVFLGVGSSKFFIIENLQKYYFYQTIIGAATNIILNLLLIPAYGAVGAAIATVISYGFSVFSFMVFSKVKTLKKIYSTIFSPSNSNFFA